MKGCDPEDHRGGADIAAGGRAATGSFIIGLPGRTPNAARAARSSRASSPTWAAETGVHARAVPGTAVCRAAARSTASSCSPGTGRGSTPAAITEDDALSNEIRKRSRWRWERASSAAGHGRRVGNGTTDAEDLGRTTASSVTACARHHDGPAPGTDGSWDVIRGGDDWRRVGNDRRMGARIPRAPAESPRAIGARCAGAQGASCASTSGRALPGRGPTRARR